MPILQVAQGRIIGPNYTGKSYVFTGGLDPKGKKELTFISSSMKAKKVGASIKKPSRSNILEDIGGSYYISRFEIEEGTVCKVVAIDESVGHGNSPKNAAMYFRIREDGPMMTLRVVIPKKVADSSCEAWEIIGRFDLLSLKKAKELGWEESGFYDDQFDDFSLSGMIEKVEMEPALAAIPVAESQTTPSGKVVKVRSRRRRIRLK